VIVDNVPAEPHQVIEPAFEITDAAQKQIKRSLARRQQTEPGAFVRVGVKGGGCSGMSYLMEPDTEFDERDRTWVTADGLRVVTDERSLEFIAGMTIDYDIKNLMEGGFVYRNPNAGRSCGCGTSFTPK
jgi:iron-sulfur cluster assembly protein